MNTGRRDQQAARVVDHAVDAARPAGRARSRSVSWWREARSVPTLLLVVGLLLVGLPLVAVLTPAQHVEVLGQDVAVGARIPPPSLAGPAQLVQLGNTAFDLRGTEIYGPLRPRLALGPLQRGAAAAAATDLGSATSTERTLTDRLVGGFLTWYAWGTLGVVLVAPARPGRPAVGRRGKPVSRSTVFRPSEASPSSPDGAVETVKPSSSRASDRAWRMRSSSINSTRSLNSALAGRPRRRRARRSWAGAWRRQHAPHPGPIRSSPRSEPAPSSLWPATVSRSSGRAAGHPGVCPVIRPSAVLVARGGSASGSPTGTSMRTEPAWANVNVTG